jgi:hypothetical protein
MVQIISLSNYHIRNYPIIISIFCSLFFNSSLSLAYFTHNIQIERSFGTTASVANEPIRVTVRFTNLEANDLRGFYYAEYFPEELNVNTVSVRLDGTAVDNYLYELDVAGVAYPGDYSARWVIETPPQYHQNNPIRQNSVLEITYALTADQDGNYELEEYSWAGCYLDNANEQGEAFGHSEYGESVSLTFDNISTVMLTLQTIGAGKVAPSLDAIGYPIGSVLNLTAIPENGWSFVRWNGEVVNQDLPSTSTVMDATKTVIAEFSAEYDIACISDFDGDFDIDGADLSAYMSDPLSLQISIIATQFGFNDCR